MIKPLPPILPFEQQPVRSLAIPTKSKPTEKKIKVDETTKIREQESKIEILEQQLSDLQFRYEHIQSLLSETDLLVESQQREILVLKHALTQQQHNNEAELIDTNNMLKKEILELKRQNGVVMEQLTRVKSTGLGISTPATVELNVDPKTAFKMKQVIDSPRLPFVDFDALQTISPQVAGLPKITSRSQSPNRSRPGSPAKQSASESNLNFAYQYDEPNPSPGLSQTNTMKPIPSIASLQEQLSAIGNLLQQPQESKLMDDQRSVTESFKNEFTNSTTHSPSRQVRVREPGEVSDHEEKSMKSSFSNSLRNILEQSSKSNTPKWVQSPALNNLFPQSPSPTKSMLVKERDALEEELLTQYGRLRKLESMESILKSLK